MRDLHFVPMLAAWWVVGGCARVIPPSDVSEPVTVYLADYGRHSSVVLPVGDGNAVEYTYGDWKFYALNQWKWYVGVLALLGSESATLGRRVLPNPSDLVDAKDKLGAREVKSIVVDGGKVRALVEEMDREYRKWSATEIYNESQGTYFVRVDSRYGLSNTCNHATARWLERLGCKVKGWTVLSRFDVKPGEARLCRTP